MVPQKSSVDSVVFGGSALHASHTQKVGQGRLRDTLDATQGAQVCACINLSVCCYCRCCRRLLSSIILVALTHQIFETHVLMPSSPCTTATILYSFRYYLRCYIQSRAQRLLSSHAESVRKNIASGTGASSNIGETERVTAGSAEEKTCSAGTGAEAGAGEGVLGAFGEFGDSNTLIAASSAQNKMPQNSTASAPQVRT